MSFDSDALQAVNRQIEQVEAQITRAEERAEEEAKKGDIGRRDYWEKEKEQLRKKEEQLRKEKEQLRDKEKLLMERSAATSSAASSHELSQVLKSLEAVQQQQQKSFQQQQNSLEKLELLDEVHQQQQKSSKSLEAVQQQQQKSLEKLELLDEVPEMFSMLCEEANKSRRKRLDCYGSSKRSGSEQADFRRDIISHYGLQEPGGSGRLYCMASGEYLPGDELRAAHIFKSATAGEGLSDFGLIPRDIHSPRNGLLIPPLIEQHMECKRLCLQWDFLHNRFLFCVSCPDVRFSGELIAPSSTIKLSDLHGQQLYIPPPLVSPASPPRASSSLTASSPVRLPFRRLLSWHADLCHEYAGLRGWVFDALPDRPGEPYVFRHVTKLSPGAKWPEREMPITTIATRPPSSAEREMLPASASSPLPSHHPVRAVRGRRSRGRGRSRGQGQEAQLRT